MDTSTKRKRDFAESTYPLHDWINAHDGRKDDRRANNASPSSRLSEEAPGPFHAEPSREGWGVRHCAGEIIHSTANANGNTNGSEPIEVFRNPPFLIRVPKIHDEDRGRIVCDGADE